MPFHRLHQQFPQFLDALHRLVADGHSELSALEAGMRKRWAPVERLLAEHADPLLVRDLVRSLPPITQIAYHHGLPPALSAEAERTAAAVSEAANALVPLTLDWAQVDTREQPLPDCSSTKEWGFRLSAALAVAGFRQLEGPAAELAAAFVRSSSNRTDMDCVEATHELVERSWAHAWPDVVTRLRPFFADASEPLCMAVDPKPMLVAPGGRFLAVLETMADEPGYLDDFRLFDRSGRCACYWAEFGNLGLWRPRHVQAGRTLV